MDAYKRYPEMTRAQARAYLTQFLDEMDASHARLVATSEASGGPSGSQLDFSIESLGPLWEWAKPRFSWRPGYALPPQGQPDPWRPQDLEPESELPSWFQHPSSVGMDRLDAESLWLCDGLGRYAARIPARPGARGEVGVRDHPSGAEQDDAGRHPWRVTPCVRWAGAR